MSDSQALLTRQPPTAYGKFAGGGGPLFGGSSSRAIGQAGLSDECLVISWPKLWRSVGHSGSSSFGTRHEALQVEHPRDDSQCPRVDQQQPDRKQDCDRECRMDHTDPQKHDHAKWRKAPASAARARRRCWWLVNAATARLGHVGASRPGIGCYLGRSTNLTDAVPAIPS